jgi:CRISPR-associated protein Cmr5
MTQTLDQKRAEYAWQVVSSVAKDLLDRKDDTKAKKQAEKLISDYTSVAKGAPVLIMGSGLMQTLAFLQAKANPKKGIPEQPHVLLLVNLIAWLGPMLTIPVAQVPTTHDEVKAAFDKAMKRLYEEPDSQIYRRATDESLALLRWIRQFADARKAMEG